MRVSLLDRSRTRTGSTEASALVNSVERGQWAEQFGYHRFWVAEHHAVPGIANGAPAVLIAALGAATSRIRLGSAGVMLPNHAPLVVSEQFLMLDALYPGRIDLGVGRSLGFTPAVRESLRADSADAARFSDDVAEVGAFLRGTASVTARPIAEHPIPMFVLATGSGVAVAAQLGLPVVVGGPVLRDPGPVLDAYRRDFIPSEHVPHPHVLVSLDVLVADTDDDAARRALPEAWAMAESRRTGEFPPLRDVTEVPSDVRPKFRETVDRSLAAGIHGSEATVARELERLFDRTGADELVSSASTFDRAALRDSDQRLAALLH